jgi:tetratricopeptide (TPR) repeat protein
MSAAAQDQDGADLAEAIAQARRALAHAPNAPGPLFVLCALLLRRGDPEANALLPRLEAFRGYGAGWCQLGEALLARRHWEGAAAAFARAEAAEPADPAGHFGQGRAQQGLGRIAAAAAAFERAADCNPGFAQAWFALGLMRDELGDPAAIVAYRAAVMADPGLHEAALNLGVACQERGDLEAALDAYGQALRTRPAAIGRIAHALSSSPTGALFLDLAGLERALRDRAPLAPGAEALAIDARP